MAVRDSKSKFVILNPVLESSSAIYSGKLRGIDGTVPSELTSLAVTIQDIDTGTYINNRKHQNILNTNGGTYAPTQDGLITLVLGPKDNTLFDKSKQEEEHLLKLEWTYTSGSNVITGKNAVIVKVLNDEVEPLGEVE